MWRQSEKEIDRPDVDLSRTFGVDIAKSVPVVRKIKVSRPKARNKQRAAWDVDQKVGD